MSGEPWDRLARAFADALQQPPDQRRRFVTDTCGADQDLCAQVLSLLRASDEADQFLAAPALDALAREVAVDGWHLRPGDQVGPYSVTQLIGAGGTGEVWRARDDRLGRDVALKVLLPHLVRDPGLTRRFAEEARAAGALNHPNVLTVYDVGEYRGAPFIIAEYLEGQSLRRRLRDGAVAPADTLAIGALVAAGLEAAHSRGIVHRDLKPDNIFLTGDGGVKILDFGLAKLYTPAGDSALAGGRLTLTGVIVGTAGYMAPEQVRGEAVDQRTDLFALGATLYEMLAGRRAFAGASTVEALHAILSTDPPALLEGNPRIPAPLARIVERLLEKAPAQRFQSASALREALEQCTQEAGSARQPRSWFPRLSWPVRVAVLTVATALVAGGWWIRGRPSRDEPVPVAQFAWPLPGQLGLDSAPAIAPDGQSLAFVGVDASTRRIYLRPLRSFESTPLAGTDGAQLPFWSPDGRSIGYFAHGKLVVVNVADAATRTLADAPDPHGGSWGASGTIVFALQGAGSPVLSVPAGGGPVQAVTWVDSAAGEAGHHSPVFLPDGIRFVYFSSGQSRHRGTRLGRIDRPATSPDPFVMPSDSAAAYVARPNGEGLLLASTGNRVAVARLDSTAHPVDGVMTLPIAVGGNPVLRGAGLSASETTLAFAPATPPGVRLGSMNRDGSDLTLRDERELQDCPRVAPDGRTLARQRTDPRSGRVSLWLEDLATGAERHVRVSGDATHPVWSPDSRRLAFAAGPSETPHLGIVAVDGSDAETTLRCPGAYCEPTDWSPDGSQIIVNVRGVGGADVWAVWMRAEGAARPLLAGPSIERDARLSPDGLWVAYVTVQADAPMVQVRPTTGGAATTVSPRGGDRPVWRRDGRELLFVDGRNRLHAVTVDRGPGTTLTLGAAVELPTPPLDEAGLIREYDVSPDGRRIYFLRRAATALPREIRIVIGWQRLLR